MTQSTPLIDHRQGPISGEDGPTQVQPLGFWGWVQIGVVILIAIAAIISPVSFDRPDPVIEQAKKDREELKDLRRAYLHLQSQKLAMEAELRRLGVGR